MPIILNGTTGEVPVSWATGGRPASPAIGQTGYNTTLNLLETYTASGWSGDLAGVISGKNKIINGSMVADQRNGGASVTTGSGNNYVTDRWAVFTSAASKLSSQQNQGSVTPPSGFANYLGVTSLSSYSVSASDMFALRQYIEGYNWSDFSYGTANAKSATLSFWVYSSLIGTFGGSFNNYAGTRAYPFSYNIPIANTWTQISITIPGDTGGTWVGASSAGAFFVSFGLGTGSSGTATAGSWQSGYYAQPTGSVSIVGSSGATFYITGVQIEPGTFATPFEREIYTTTLDKCCRYYVGAQDYYFTAGYDPNYTSINSGGVEWDYQMRAVPTVTILAGGMDGHHGYAPTLRGGSVSNGAPLAFSGAGLRTNVNCSAYVRFTLSAEL